MRILIIEDDKEIANYLKRSLEAEYFAVDTVHDGENGLSLATLNSYDLIILDLSLPSKGGRDICREIRLAGNYVPIIILSVISDTLNRVEILNLGADDFLSKPFSFEELLARIKALLRRPKSVIPEVMESGGLRVDLTNKTAKRGVQEIYLTKKEFMVLEYLLRNRGKVVSRTSLFEHAWDMNTDPFSNTVDAHILSLRKKLGSASGQRMIQTIPGRGYRID